MRLFSRPEKAVLLVCTANICRSAMGEWVMCHQLQELEFHKKIKVDSAGTHATQPGQEADQRAQRVCSSQGIELRRSRARQVTERDFFQFDYILAMDSRNLAWLLKQRPGDCQCKISLVTSWMDEDSRVGIPDPYYGNLAGFEVVLDMLQASIHGFIKKNLK